MGKENLQLEIDAINKVGASKGDYVALNMETVDVLRAASIIYVIPLIALVIGIFGGIKVFEFMNIAQFEILGLLVGVLFMVVAFMMIKKNENKLHNDARYLTAITRILAASEVDVDVCDIKVEME